MTIRREVPPIKIPIEITIEDKEFAKIQRKIGQRKKEREDVAMEGFVKQFRRQEKERLREIRLQERLQHKDEAAMARTANKNRRAADRRQKSDNRIVQRERDDFARKQLAMLNQIARSEEGAVQDLAKSEKLKSLATDRRIGFGKTALSSAAGIGNPLALVTGLLGRLIPLAIPLVIISATDRIIKALTQKGSIFDLTFRNIVDDRINVLRSRESQQEIRVGFEGKSQLIVTTRAGSTSPLLSYNTYEQRNNNTLEFEKMRAVREVGAP